MIRTLFWDDGSVVMIDQKALPRVERTVRCRSAREVAAAIRDMTVRGAPAIGVAAAMGIAVGMLRARERSAPALEKRFGRICGLFAATRPTARNLFWAIERMKRVFARNLKSGSGTEALRQDLVREAIRICEEDLAANKKIGRNGRDLVRDGANLLTHCNAGALATAGYGTALGVMRAAWEQGKRFHVYVDETRPVLQGSRLTAWELMKESIPATLIADNMAGTLMAQGRIDAILVGADRIAANGDTANKIGTYPLAVLARENGVPFYVAAPLSTVDPGVRSGKEIPIEQRNPSELTECAGKKIAPKGIKVYNPAFDITPYLFVTAIITESGVHSPPYKFT